MNATDTYTSGHVHLWTDKNGDVVEASVFCGDYCHRQFLAMRNVKYEGWNGCHEMPAPSYCDNCGDEF